MFVVINKKRFFSVCVLLAALAAAILFFCLKTPIEKQIYPQKHKVIVQKAATCYGVDELLIYSIIKAESGFNKNAVSKSGAKGLMQLMDETALWASEKSGITLENIYDPETNIMLGTWYIAYLTENSGDMLTALASYNAGASNVKQWCAESGVDKISVEYIQFEETRNYVNKILKYYKKYQKIYGGE